MSKCHISYVPLPDGVLFDASELKKLSPKLSHLEPLDLTLKEQIEESQRRVAKTSIQGIQLKLSAKLNVKHGRFEIVDTNGRYILKPQGDYPELPQNEALTMRLSKTVGIKVPPSGLIPGKDGSLCYFVKRFDRSGHNRKFDMEDFAQLSFKSRETKYDSSIERVVKIIDEHATFPSKEKVVFFTLFLFNYLVGNEDVHLKNYSLITQEGLVKLSPAYDLVNTTIALRNPQEESALPLNGKKRNLTQKDIFLYLASKILHLPLPVTENIRARMASMIPRWIQLIDSSFLSNDMKIKYKELLTKRSAILP